MAIYNEGKIREIFDAYIEIRQITQKEIAEVMGVDAAILSRKLSGKPRFTPADAPRLIWFCQHVGIEDEDLEILRNALTRTLFDKLNRENWQTVLAEAVTKETKKKPTKTQREEELLRQVSELEKRQDVQADDISRLNKELNRVEESLAVFQEQLTAIQKASQQAVPPAQIGKSEMVAPAWAHETGTDEFGRFADLRVKDAVQRMRWIEAGEFMMGSPEIEEGRYDNEVLHKVHLTEGFWLAETACSQAFYQAVVGENPSEFKGNDLPVENVSWEDAQMFTLKLNALTKTGLFRLPTEVEWEYACRAGSETAFAYGYKINNRLTNNNQRHTVSVKSLYQNKWGMYQMHGNVWEWCSDWFATYDSTDNVVLNPQGANDGISRVLRGGSWDYSAWSCRSASRDLESDESRLSNVGFRFASGLQET